MGKDKKAKAKAKREKKLQELADEIADEPVQQQPVLQAPPQQRIHTNPPQQQIEAGPSQQRVQAGPPPQRGIRFPSRIATTATSHHQAASSASSGPQIAGMPFGLGEQAARLQALEAGALSRALSSSESTLVGRLPDRIEHSSFRGGPTEEEMDNFILLLNGNARATKSARREVAAKFMADRKANAAAAAAEAEAEVEAMKSAEEKVDEPAESKTEPVEPPQEATPPEPVQMIRLARPGEDTRLQAAEAARTMFDVAYSFKHRNDAIPDLPGLSPPARPGSAVPRFSSFKVPGSRLPGLNACPCKDCGRTPISTPSPQSPPLQRTPYLGSTQKLPSSEMDTNDFILAMVKSKNAKIRGAYHGLKQSSLESDPEKHRKALAGVTAMGSATGLSRARPNDRELQAQLRASADASREGLKELLADLPAQYLAGFLDATKLSLQMEEASVIKQKEAVDRSGIRITTAMGGPPPVDMIPAHRQEFIQGMIKATPHLAQKLYDDGVLDECHSCKIWFSDGEICWGANDPPTAPEELAALKKRYPNAHDCIGDERDENGFCLTCLTDMNGNYLLDFSPVLGLPGIQRPKGWKPPAQDEDDDVVSETGILTPTDEDPSLPHGMSNPGLRQVNQEILTVEASTERVAGNKKKRNRKKKKKKTATEASQVADEPKPCGPSFQVTIKETPKPVENPSARSPVVSGVLGNPFTGVPCIVEGPDGQSFQLEYVTGAAAKTLQDEYQKLLPAAIPDSAKFKFKTHGQPEYEITGQEMREILHKEMAAYDKGDPEFTAAFLQGILGDINVENLNVSKKSEKTAAKPPAAPSTTESPGRVQVPSASQPKTPHPVEPHAKNMETDSNNAKVDPNKKKEGTRPLEEYNILRSQRLQVVLGIGRFVIESIRAGKRPCFDVSLDGRIEFAHADHLYPIRMSPLGFGSATKEASSFGIGIGSDDVEVKMVTAPIISIRDKVAPDIGDGINSVIRDFQCPNIVTSQEMFCNVDMIRPKVADPKGKGILSEEAGEAGNPVPKNITFGLKPSIMRARAKNKMGEPVFLGSQKYKILPSDGRQDEDSFEGLQPLAKTFCRAVDICEEAQNWVKTQKRNISIREVLGEDKLWPVNTAVPREPIDGDDSKPATKPAPNKPVPVKKPGNVQLSQRPVKVSSRLMRDLEEKEKKAASTTVNRDRFVAYMESVPRREHRVELGLEAHLRRMNQHLEVAQANYLKTKALVEEALKGQPSPPLPASAVAQSI
ncbi:hypothetical protein TWF718_002827 [Orbilia javanica]|uniref:Uncharacterized protein n=1 Tax=Orbilia javanica TaxID=47235 RepID=A0AAN8MPI2_9PEZI